MNWHIIVGEVQPHIVHISTPYGDGTGFLCLYNSDKSIAGIATAAHVIGEADRWKQPIELYHPTSDSKMFFEASARASYIEWTTDSAVFLIPSNPKFPQQLIPLLPFQQNVSIGVEVGWIGFPSVAPPYQSCFFSGNISARLDDRKAYLVDGVAINGVSGGPVIYCDMGMSPRTTQIVGVVSSYRINRATGEALPGMLVAQDVSHFHDVASHVRSIDEAKKLRPSVPPPPSFFHRPNPPPPPPPAP